MTFVRRPIRGQSLALALFFSLIPSLGMARETLTMEPFQGRKVRVDGSLGDWPAQFEKLDSTLSGQGVEASALVGYDDTSLYFALKTNSARIVRKAKPGPGQDHATLEIVFPGKHGEKGRAHSVDIYPGDPGKIAGAVLVDGKQLGSAEIVEFERDGGFDVEVRLPWSALPEAATLRVGLKGRISFHDASAPGKMVALVSTSPKGQLKPLVSLVEAGLIDTLVGDRGLRPVPAREAYGELTGGGSLERVALYNNILTIVGPDYRGGSEFFLSELDVNSAAQIQRLELFDFNRDGKDEIVIEKRLSPSSLEFRQVVSVLAVSSDGVPSQVFVAEVAIVTRAGKIENKVSLSKAKGEPSLLISQGSSSGFEFETFREPTLGEGIPSALLPWGPVEARRYTFRGQKFVVAEETPKKPLKGQTTRSTQKTTPKEQPAARGTPSSERAGAEVPAAPNVDRLYALYRKNRGPTLGPMRAEFWQDVAEDERTERVVWHDRELLVLGEGFQGGTKFAALTLPVKEAKDVISVSLLEATGDAKLDIVVHALLHAQTGEAPKKQAVVRQVLFIYRIESGRIAQTFAAEIGRTVGKRQILGAYRFHDVEGRLVLDLLRGRALGFTEDNYPFSEEPNPERSNHAKSGPEGPTGPPVWPLVLPWSGTAQRRFSFSAGEFRETT
jgi:hypothetical protein